eukprot:270517-Rhodomonas_salina.1
MMRAADGVDLRERLAGRTLEVHDGEERLLAHKVRRVAVGDERRELREQPGRACERVRLGERARTSERDALCG